MFFCQDLGLAMTAANTTGAPVPLGGLAGQFYKVLCMSGYAKKDFSSVYKFISEEKS